ncbi:MAG: hypothetical protein WHX53_04210, partial [Anaerolineae bacterium]
MLKPRAVGILLQSWLGRVQRLAGDRSFWALLAMFGGLTALHYLRPQISLIPIGFVERHAMERVV